MISRKLAIMCTWLAALAWTLRISLSCKTKGWVSNSVVVTVATLFDLNISNNDKRLIDLCKNLTVDNIEKTRISGGKKLRSNDIGKKASEIALNPSIRNELINLQRKYAKFDRSLYNGIILDGRDIGTVV